MACPYCVAAKPFQYKEPPAPGLLVKSRAQNTAVMVKADTFQFNVFAVHEKAFFGDHLDAADTKGCFPGPRIIFAYGRAKPVKQRIFGAPKLGGFYCEVALHNSFKIEYTFKRYFRGRNITAIGITY